MSTSDTPPGDQHRGRPHRSPVNRGYSAIGTISAAFTSLWGSSSGFLAPKGNVTNAGIGVSQDQANDDSQRSAVEPKDEEEAGGRTLPGGWGTSYFSRTTARPHVINEAPVIREGNQDDQNGHPAWKNRSASGSRKRSAIPFDNLTRPLSSEDASGSRTHSRKVSADSKSPCGLRTADETSSGGIQRRLKPQSSLSSLRSNDFETSFITADGSFVQGDESDSDQPHSEDQAAAETPVLLARSHWRDLPAASDEGETKVDRTSIRPGAPPPKDWKEALAKAALLDSYVQDIVYQSGIDDQMRPIIVLSSPALPNPREVDYDALLGRIMDQMELFVQNDYTVLFFAGGSAYRPPWTWIWSAYRRLSRPFRKNCRRLLICHPTFFTRTLVRFVSTGSSVLSPKFARKILQINTLSELAQHIDLTQVAIPPDVLKYNMQYEKQVVLPQSVHQSHGDGQGASAASKVFGVPLKTLMGERGEKGGIPRVVRDCVEELQRGSNLESEGIFRKSPSSALLRAAQEAYDRGQPVTLGQYNDCNIPAVLLKLFFRSLPSPIFPASIYPLVRSCPIIRETDEEAMREVINHIRSTLLSALQPQSKVVLLAYVLELLHKTSRRAEQNRMDPSNLATVWVPNLVRSTDPMRDVAMCAVAPSGESQQANSKAPPATLGTILKVCIERYYEVFEYDEMDYEPPTYDAHSFAEALESPTPATKELDPASPDNILRSPQTARTHSSLTPASPDRGSSFSLPYSHTSRQAFRSPSSSRHAGGGGSSMHSAGLGLGFAGPSLRAGLGNPMSIGRSASGSLRLTRARLGSGTMGGGTPSSSGIFLSSALTPGMPSSPSPSALELHQPYGPSSAESGLAFGGGLTSGVALTGANAVGLFTTSTGSTEPTALNEEAPSLETVRNVSRTSTGTSHLLSPAPSVSSLRSSVRARSGSGSSSFAYSSTPDKKARNEVSHQAGGDAGGGDGAANTANTTRTLRKHSSRSLTRLRATALAGPVLSLQSPSGEFNATDASGGQPGGVSNMVTGRRPLSELREDMERDES